MRVASKRRINVKLHESNKSVRVALAFWKCFSRGSEAAHRCGSFILLCCGSRCELCFSIRFPCHKQDQGSEPHASEQEKNCLSTEAHRWYTKARLFSDHSIVGKRWMKPHILVNECSNCKGKKCQFMLFVFSWNIQDPQKKKRSSGAGSHLMLRESEKSRSWQTESPWEIECKQLASPDRKRQWKAEFSLWIEAASVCK